MAKRLRMGFIGCGGNASGHVKRVLSLPEVEIVALNDVSQDSLDRMCERNPEVKGLPTFPDFREMLDAVEMDAVEISTPHTCHFEQIMESLDRGLHVLTEKPMVCTVAHAEQVIRKADEVGKVLMLSYQRHFDPGFRYIRNQIAAGELGEIRFISAMQSQDWYRSQQGTWRQNLALSGGGQLNDSASHLLDIILWTTGLAVDEVSGYVENMDTEVDINSALSIRFTNGAIGNISVVGYSPGGFWEDITFWGTQAVIYLRNGHITYRSVHTGESFEPEGLPQGSDPDKNFVDAVFGRDEVQVPPVCGLRVIELTEAAWESGRTGRPAKVVRSKLRLANDK